MAYPEPVQNRQVTALLLRWQNGDQNAVQELMPLLYSDLRRLAAKLLRKERSGHTLQTTALVHEAYLRLAGRTDFAVETRNEFFSIAAQTFRRILVDHARKRMRGKRGGNAPKVALEEHPDVSSQRSFDLLRLDDALRTLSELSPRQGKVVELKFFGGLELEEIAAVMNISTATIKRDWTAARALLLREMSR